MREKERGEREERERERERERETETEMEMQGQAEAMAHRDRQTDMIMDKQIRRQREMGRTKASVLRQRWKPRESLNNVYLFSFCLLFIFN